mmetsp:Transcript_42996/g.30970  ORF Transcript_42996/g.30970 Transcript_42996/m.30970 type:complete len:96 (-) Transcript_42996:291-578(-)|eukprot:CAMPEP_0116870448 /NCGR_PEP_ID=MMETSP0463-20121206/362_1 /TAXON_ID=181622 /ORGANISM="Strombidinopsis sp, Strain SopsisLIS2011" /LENGTH=95 /DNA_ID=CAMNT_0004507007 /DNA_START=227 /DNA_END=514 /DNA_ORIENTATION=-
MSTPGGLMVTDVTATWKTAFLYGFVLYMLKICTGLFACGASMSGKPQLNLLNFFLQILWVCAWVGLPIYMAVVFWSEAGQMCSTAVANAAIAAGI